MCCPPTLACTSAEINLRNKNSKLGEFLSEFASYVYYEYLSKIPDRLSYGENHPERKAFYRLLEKRSQRKGYDLVNLKRLVIPVEEKVKPAQDFPNETFSYLGLAGIEPYTGHATFENVKGKEILSTSKRFYKGNIVFAGLRPYLNKAHLVEIEEGIGSAELFVVQPKKELIVPEFLLKYLLSDLVLTQTRWILTGCSYPRLTPEDFMNLKIILPDKNVQKQILRRIKALEEKAEKNEKKTRELSERSRNLVLSKLGIRMPSPNIFTLTIHDFYSSWIDENPEERLDFVYHHPWMNKIRDLLSSCLLYTSPSPRD